jgi:hypothetical protein
MRRTEHLRNAWPRLILRMILPSDDNSTPEKKPRKRRPEGEPNEPETPSFDAPPEDWSPDEMWDKFLEDALEDASLTSQEEWRELLKQELVSAVEDLENFPDPGTDFDPPDPPDLYHFYAEILAMRQESRASMKDILRKLNKKPTSPAMSTEAAVQIGVIAGELRAQGLESIAERLLLLIDKHS